MQTDILIVEDSATQAARLEEELRGRGYQTQIAADGSEALEVVRRFRPALILSDVKMPVMDGFQLCRAIKQDPGLRCIPVILLTSLSSPADVLSALEAGADFHVPKPYLTDYLLEVVGELLARRSDTGRTEPETVRTVTHDGIAYQISASHEHVVRLLLSTYEVAIQQNRDLLSAREGLRSQNVILEQKVRERTANLTSEMADRKRAEQTLREAKDHLEIRVKQRTVELEQTNRTLQVEIAERKSAEEAANLERQRLYDVLETLPAYVVLLSADYHVPFANRVFRERFGESEGRRCYEYLFNRATPCDTCETYTVLKTAAPHHWEWLGPDNRNYDIFDFPFTGTDGAPLILEMGIDVTEKKHAQVALSKANESLERRVAERTTELRLSEAVLRESQARYRAVAQSANLAIVTADGAGNIVDWNPRAETMFGYTAAEVLGSPLTLLMPGKSRELHLAGLRRVQSGGEPHVIGRSVELDGRRKDSSEFPLELSLAKWTTSEGWFVTGMMADITERKRLETQFLQAQKMEVVGRLASGIAHDFNNLLTVINGTADLALTDLKEGAPLRADLQNVRQAGERAASLTRQLLAFSRKQIMKFETLDLRTLVADLQGMLQRLIGENIALVVMPAKEVGCVMADSAQIEQVVMNLAVNARDAMLNGGTLTIETRDVALDDAFAAEHPSVQPGPHVMLAISDTGTGMDEATLARMFEPFFTTKALGKGTGLGLSTVYGIVKQSGGSIWVSSEPGVGTSFKIYLPRVEGGVRKIQPAPVVTSVHGAETILVVEDEEAVRRLAMRVLQMAGYTVLTASSGAEALLLLARHDGPVHLMLTDMVMPGMSGRELVAQIEALSPRMKILRTSGYTDEAVLHNELLDQAAHFIGKPYGVAELTRKVREVLDSDNG